MYITVNSDCRYNFVLSYAIFFGWKQDLTEFNTAHNKRISSLGIEEGSTKLTGVTSLKRKRRSSLSVQFREGEEIINPGKDLGRID